MLNVERAKFITLNFIFCLLRLMLLTVILSYFYKLNLNLDASTALANALVSSRLDYCNSLLHSIPKVHLDKLQRVQSSLARVVTKSTRFTSNKPLLKRLHWLPIASRIDFKIATLTYKAVNLKQPPSLA